MYQNCGKLVPKSYRQLPPARHIINKTFWFLRIKTLTEIAAKRGFDQQAGINQSLPALSTNWPLTLNWFCMAKFYLWPLWTSQKVFLLFSAGSRIWCYLCVF